MSAREFKPGDRVRCVDVTGQPSESLKLDDTALYTVASITHHGWLVLESNPGPWLPSRFEKVDLGPRFVEGQQVVGNDYAGLPIGSVVFEKPSASDSVKSVPIAKTGEDEWTNQGWPGVFTNADLVGDVRTLTRLGGGLIDHGQVPVEQDERIAAWERVANHPIFEGSRVVEGPFIDAVIARLDELLQIAYVMPGDPDADDAYVEPQSPACVHCGEHDGKHGTNGKCLKAGYYGNHYDPEPEPLQPGDWVQVWAQVGSPRDDGDTVCRLFYGPRGSYDERVRNDAIVRPSAGQVPPWEKAEISAIAAALRSEGGMVYADSVVMAGSLHRAGIRATEGGAS